MKIDFINPSLCADLLKLGLSNNTLHSWRWRNGGDEAFLFSRSLDYLGIYDEENLPESVRTKYSELPAYSISLLIHLIPDIMICRQDGEWLVTGSNSVIENPVRDKDLGIALAELLKELLIKGSLLTKNLNNKINKFYPLTSKSNQDGKNN